MPRPVAQRIQQKLIEIAADPYATHNNVTKLQNRDGYRLRIGDWRALYLIEDEKLIIFVFKIASRGDVYR